MHVPVLLEEVLRGLSARPGSMIIDATAGGGGHAEALLRQILPDGTLLCLDRDPDAVDRVRKRLSGAGGRVVVEHSSFERIAEVAHTAGMDGVDGIIMDLGMSSNQLGDAARGFSFMHDGPLDMRMDPQEPTTAAELVNELEEEDLARIFFEYGEERNARKIARVIVEHRAEAPLRTTGELAALVERVGRPGRGRIHAATRTFQALRIAVNRELEVLEQGLEEALPLLRVGGRIVVISFHSLEDRIVKQIFSAHVGRMASLPQGGQRWEGTEPRAKYVFGKRPRSPGDQEQRENPRARSAKLRVVEREG
jgi:16S rRNA (cytosine1402-N4)-methyltransferase